MSYRDWYVGMKVVCVNADGWEHKLVLRRVYTVSAIGTGPFSDQVYVGLEETPSSAGNHVQWRIERFRPVQPRKTDISIFTAMLTGSKQKEPA